MRLRVEIKIKQRFENTLNGRAIDTDVSVAHIRRGSFVSQFVSGIVVVIHKCDQIVGNLDLRSHQLYHLCAILEQLSDFGIIVFVGWEPVGLVNDEFFQCNFEVAVQKDQSDTIPGYQPTALNKINYIYRFNQTQCPGLSFCDRLILTRLPYSTRLRFSWYFRQDQTSSRRSLCCLGHFDLSSIILNDIVRPVLLELSGQLTEMPRHLDNRRSQVLINRMTEVDATLVACPGHRDGRTFHSDNRPAK